MNNILENSNIEDFNKFIREAVSPFHTTESAKKRLKLKGFKELKAGEDFDIRAGEKYYIDIYDSSLMAFTVGKNFTLDRNWSKKGVLRFTSSHTDFPGFKIKPDSVIKDKQSGKIFIKVNTEGYGGAILNTWMDRPLSIAGRIIVRGKDEFSPESVNVNVDKPVLIIPNLSIHLNRNINKGIELNKQKDLIPIAGISDELHDNFKDYVIDVILKEELNRAHIIKENILDYELYLYNKDDGQTIGVNGEMFSAPRIDNLSSVYAQLNAIINSKNDDSLNVAFFFDNEEIGSRTKQGAASAISIMMLEKIYEEMEFDKIRMTDDIINGIMISCDVAHGYHPNYPEKSDVTNKVILGGGIVVKVAAAQTYSNDGIGIAVVKEICRKKSIPYQIFVNRSDMAGGQTLGAIFQTVMPIRTIDIGIAVLAMHSARELMGTEDEKTLEKFLTGYYS